jgi:hypothetical protein
MTRLRLRALVVVAAGGLLPLLFVVFHSGPLGEDACAREGFTGPGDLSLAPLGTLCRGGENGSIESVLINNYFWLSSGLVVFALVALIALWFVMRAPSPSARQFPL